MPPPDEKREPLLSYELQQVVEGGGGSQTHDLHSQFISLLRKVLLKSALYFVLCNYLCGLMFAVMQQVVGEIFAAFMVVFTIMAVKVNTHQDTDTASSLLALSVGGGLITMVTIFTVGHVSGSHINPAVTIAYTIIKHFPLQLAPLYVCAQLIGGIIAAALVEVIFRPPWEILIVTPKGSVLQAIFAEGVAGFLLLFVAASVATDTRAIGQFAGLAIGAIIALNILIVGPISGGGINPARALGPAVVTGHFLDVWIYLVGPTVGGILGALMYWLLRPEDVRKKVVHQQINIQEASKTLTSWRRWNSEK